MKKRILSILAAALTLAACTSCSASFHSAKQLSTTQKAPAVSVTGSQQQDATQAYLNFTASLLQHTFSGDNLLLSPLSAADALCLTMEGAAGETQQQMETVLGEAETMGGYFSTIRGASGEQLTMADSVWIRNDPALSVNDNFLAIAAGNYQAEVYSAPFDEDTCSDINTWVKNKTDGEIQNLIDKIYDSDMLYLINTTLFDAKWQDEYEDNEIRDRDFTTVSGETTQVKMMYSDEHTYLENDFCTGLMKYYKDEKYTFAALLPKDDVTIYQLVDRLNAETLDKLLSQRISAEVEAGIPVFTSDTKLDLAKILPDMGMPLAFSSGADFSDMATYDGQNLYIGRVIHQTRIEVNEQGTKAAAATAVVMESGKVATSSNSYTVILNRPFVYMIVDMEQEIPVFIGVMTDPA